MKGIVSTIAAEPVAIVRDARKLIEAGKVAMALRVLATAPRAIRTAILTAGVPRSTRKQLEAEARAEAAARAWEKYEWPADEEERQPTAADASTWRPN